MKGIVAMDLNRVIGNKGKIPWHLSADMKFFNRMTSDPVNGGFLIMGRKTFESVGVLPNRHTYVLTTDQEKIHLIDLCGYKYVDEDGLWKIGNPDHKFWVCGGAEIYRKFLSQCSEVYVTIVLGEYEGDTFLDPFEDNFPFQELICECKTHWIVKYAKEYVKTNI